METQDTTTETLEIIHLLDEIVRAFADGSTRPHNRIAIYEKYLELRKTHDAKLVGRLIVIGGRGPRRLWRNNSRAKTRDKAAALKSANGQDHAGLLPNCAQ
jgi:hypothetical protein